MYICKYFSSSLIFMHIWFFKLMSIFGIVEKIDLKFSSDVRKELFLNNGFNFSGNRSKIVTGI